jgi:polysaccharide export outer membrane protein
MIKPAIRTLFLLLCVLSIFSCRTLNPSVMFQTEKGYPYSTDSINPTEYLIAIGDHIEMKIFTNDAFKLVDVTTNNSGGVIGNNQSIYYIVEKDGTVKLPLIGKIQILGLKVRDAEKMLEEKYATYYITPFVMLRVINLHVLVFQGDGGAGSVVTLQNENTSLIEALTMAGGVHSRGKAFKIKVIRGNLKNPQIYLVDLSTIEGVKKSSMTVQANDIIYVEPSGDYSSKVLVQLSPYIGMLTAVLLVLNLFNK